MQVPDHSWPEFSDIVKSKVFRRICKEATHAIGEYSMLAEGDKVLVGLSGGEDSLALMHVMVNLQRRAPFHFTVCAVTVDMDFSNFDSAVLSEYANFYGWEWHHIHFPGQRLMQEKNAEDRPCAFCSRMRRGQLHATADELGCNKIALGQHLDDLCVSLLLALFRGGGLKTMGANVAADSGKKRLIRPFCTIRKSLLHQLALELDYPRLRSCPYEDRLRKDGDRAYLESLVNSLEGHFKDIRGAMLKAMKDVRLAHLLDKRYLSFDEDDPDQGKL